MSVGPGQNGTKGSPPQWDSGFARSAAMALIIVGVALVYALVALAEKVIDDQPDLLAVAIVAVAMLVVAGLALAGLGAYIGLLEARGRARVIGTMIVWENHEGEAEPKLGEPLKEAAAIFEAMGKMPTARALVTAGGVALLAAAALAWQVLPEADLAESGPQITRQPATVSTTAGGKAFFRVVAEGSDLGYRWERNGEPIDGAGDSPTYLIANTAAAEDGDTITVAVSEGEEEAISDDVKLSVEVTQPSGAGS
jgi:hypothetical protein